MQAHWFWLGCIEEIFSLKMALSTSESVWLELGCYTFLHITSKASAGCLIQFTDNLSMFLQKHLEIQLLIIRLCFQYMIFTLELSRQISTLKISKYLISSRYITSINLNFRSNCLNAIFLQGKHAFFQRVVKCWRMDLKIKKFAYACCLVATFKQVRYFYQMSQTNPFFVR